MKKIIIGVTTICLSLSACAPVEQLQDYKPTIDVKNTNISKFESDLIDCRAIATQKEAEYKKEYNEKVAANIITGILVGAVVGNVAGNSYGSNKSGFINAGIAAGAAGGIAETSEEAELATYGPKRIVDRCLISRGHPVISDLGKG